MAVKLRLKRMGSKQRPFYRIVAADARFPRDGRFIETVGTYNPIANPAEISINKERFVMAKGYYNRTCYKDTSMYDYFEPILSKKLQEINATNFNTVWDDIMIDSGMIRDNNLLELFNDIDYDKGI